MTQRKQGVDLQEKEKTISSYGKDHCKSIKGNPKKVWSIITDQDYDRNHQQGPGPKYREKEAVWVEIVLPCKTFPVAG